MFALSKELCVFVLGAKLDLWIPVLETKLPFFFLKCLSMELAFLLSLLCWNGPSGCMSLTRQQCPGRRDDGTPEALSVVTCVLCVQAVFWHRKAAYQSLLLALHDCFYLLGLFGSLQSLFPKGFHPDHLWEILVQCLLLVFLTLLWVQYKS